MLRGMLIAGALAVLLPAAGRAAQTFVLRGITIEKELVVAAPPDEAWRAFTGDVSGWWDHHFSPNPERFAIDRVAGGAFMETFDAGGHGVKHADVIGADPGKMLRLQGPLGLAGKAVDLVHTFTFAPDPGGTKIHLTLNGMGQLSDQDVADLEAVWDHFLIERFQKHVAAGKHRQ